MSKSPLRFKKILPVQKSFCTGVTTHPRILERGVSVVIHVCILVKGPDVVVVRELLLETVLVDWLSCELGKVKVTISLLLVSERGLLDLHSVHDSKSGVRDIRLGSL